MRRLSIIHSHDFSRSSPAANEDMDSVRKERARKKQWASLPWHRGSGSATRDGLLCYELKSSVTGEREEGRCS